MGGGGAGDVWVGEGGLLPDSERHMLISDRVIEPD